jgi:hypothetical protein
MATEEGVEARPGHDRAHPDRPAGGARGDSFPTGCGAKTIHHVPPRPGAPLRLSGKTIKVTLVVDGAVLAGYTVPEGARPRIVSATGGRTVTAELNPKSMLKTIAAIREHDASAVPVVLQGSLGPGDVLEQAGISRPERRNAWI